MKGFLVFTYRLYLLIRQCFSQIGKSVKLADIVISLVSIPYSIAKKYFFLFKNVQFQLPFLTAIIRL